MSLYLQTITGSVARNNMSGKNMIRSQRKTSWMRLRMFSFQLKNRPNCYLSPSQIRFEKTIKETHLLHSAAVHLLVLSFSTLPHTSFYASPPLGKLIWQTQLEYPPTPTPYDPSKNMYFAFLPHATPFLCFHLHGFNEKNSCCTLIYRPEKTHDHTFCF